MSNYHIFCCSMRPRYKTPMNRRYFHTKRKVDKKDLNYLKKKIEVINKKKIKEEINEKERRKVWNK